MKSSGVVVKSTGSWYSVQLDTGSIVQCRIRGKFRIEGLKLTNPVTVGDQVKLTLDEEEIGIITDILPRKNYVVRQSPRKKHSLHLLASNIDRAFVVVTIVEPMLKQGFIDRFLVMTEPYNIPVHIIFNKKDLYQEKDLNVYQYLEDIYTKIGYQVHLVSAITGEGHEALRTALKGRTILISGQSGVGKSTLVNNLDPTLALKTQELSDYSGKGQHTTTFAEMHKVASGGFIIDTPGIKTLGFNHLEVMDIAHNFKEFFVASKHCKFNNCTHRNEPKCAVKALMEEGEISELRYFNYLALCDEVEEQNYWERHSDI